MTNEDYNGWSNRETWAYALHLGNDEGLYNEIHERAEEIIKHEKDADTAIWKLADMLKEYLEELKSYQQEMREAKIETHQLDLMLEDIGSEWRIDFDEIAENEFSDELKELKTAPPRVQTPSALPVFPSSRTAETVRREPNEAEVKNKNKGDYVIETKRFKDTRTGEIKTQFSIFDIKYMQEIKENGD